MDDTSGIEHQPREGAEANVCGFSTVYFVSKALDGILELAATRKYSDLASLARSLPPAVCPQFAAREDW
jgi:hypothetical protein